MIPLFIIPLITLSFQRKPNPPHLSHNIHKIINPLDFGSATNCATLLPENEHYSIVTSHVFSLATGLGAASNPAFDALENYLSTTLGPLHLAIGAAGDNDIVITQSTDNGASADLSMTFYGTHNSFKNDGSDCIITAIDSSMTGTLYDLSEFVINGGQTHYWFFCLIIEFELRINSSILPLDPNDPNSIMVQGMILTVNIHNICIDENDPDSHDTIAGPIFAAAILENDPLPTVVAP